jgi:hypothetical protein
MAGMKGITIKLPDATMRRLRARARATGQPVSALIRSRLEGSDNETGETVHGIASDLAGSLTGPRRAASNDRRRFRRR